MWERVASVVGILAAIGAVWARFVSLETRAEITEDIVGELAGEVKSLNTSIQRLELQLARQVCVYK